jgi:hypothetical protein
MKKNHKLINYICIMKKKEIILVAAAVTGLYLVLRGLKKANPTKGDEDFKNFIGSDGQGKYFNADGRMSLDNIVRSYKKP